MPAPITKRYGNDKRLGPEVPPRCCNEIDQHGLVEKREPCYAGGEENERPTWCLIMTVNTDDGPMEDAVPVRFCPWCGTRFP